jgi:hypothetical protein
MPEDSSSPEGDTSPQSLSMCRPPGFQHCKPIIRWLTPPAVPVSASGLCIMIGGFRYRMKLFPNMFRVILHFMSGKHFQKLFLEGAFFVVFYLAINLVRNEICLGATDSESTISILPVKILQSVL